MRGGELRILNPTNQWPTFQHLNPPLQSLTHFGKKVALDVDIKCHNLRKSDQHSPEEKRNRGCLRFQTRSSQVRNSEVLTNDRDSPF